jgi:hypothetical protein
MNAQPARVQPAVAPTVDTAAQRGEQHAHRAPKGGAVAVAPLIRCATGDPVRLSQRTVEMESVGDDAQPANISCPGCTTPLLGKPLKCPVCGWRLDSTIFADWLKSRTKPTRRTRRPGRRHG